LFTNYTARRRGPAPRWRRTAAAFSGLAPKAGWRAGTAITFAAIRPIRRGRARWPTASFWPLHTDDRGRLWAGTSSGGLARYDAERDAFITVARPFGTGATRRWWAITDDGRGGLWVGTGGGLDTSMPMAACSGRRRTKSNPWDYPKAVWQALLSDRTGTLWPARGMACGGVNAAPWPSPRLRWGVRRIRLQGRPALSGRRCAYLGRHPPAWRLRH